MPGAGGVVLWRLRQVSVPAVVVLLLRARSRLCTTLTSSTLSCSSHTLEPDLKSVAFTTTGRPGAAPFAGGPAGGSGDVVSPTLTDLRRGGRLYVCVDIDDVPGAIGRVLLSGDHTNFAGILDYLSSSASARP